MNYSEEEKEVIEQVKEELKRVHKINHLSGTYVPIDYLEIMLNLIEKQNKIIDKFSKALVNCVGTCPIDYNDDFENDCENCQDTLEKCWIEYFKKVVDEDVKD